jgi:hypothetical protein
MAVSKRERERGNIYFLTDDEREGVLWAIALGLRHDDGFAFPRDQNRAILRSARDRLTFPYKIEDEA